MFLGAFFCYMVLVGSTLLAVWLKRKKVFLAGIFFVLKVPKYGKAKGSEGEKSKVNKPKQNQNSLQTTGT